MTVEHPQPKRPLPFPEDGKELDVFPGVTIDLLKCMLMTGLFLVILLQLPLSTDDIAATFLLGGAAILAFRTYHQVAENHRLLTDNHILHVGYTHLSIGILDGAAFLAILLQHYHFASTLWILARFLEIAGLGLALRLTRLDLSLDSLFPPYLLAAFVPIVVALGSGEVSYNAPLPMTQKFFIPASAASACALGMLFLLLLYHRASRQHDGENYGRFVVPFFLKLVGILCIGIGDAVYEFPLYIGVALYLLGTLMIYHEPVAHPYRETLQRLREHARKIHAWQKHLRNSEHELRATFFGYEPITSTFSHANAYLESLGHQHTTERMTIHQWATHIHDDDRTAFTQNLQACLADSRIFTMTYRLQTGNSGWCWTRTDIHPTSWDEQGRLVHAVGLHTDITSDMQQYHQKDVHMRHMATFFEQLPACAYIKDREGRFECLNTKFIHTYDADAWAGRFDYELFTEHSVADLRARADDVIANGSTTVTQCIRQHDGSEKCTDLLLFPIRENADASIRIGALELAHPQGKSTPGQYDQQDYDTIFAALNDGLFDVTFSNWNMTDIHFSPAWYKMIGYEPHELPESYETWRALLHPEDMEQAEARLWTCVRNGTTYENEYRMHHKDGSWVWIHARGTFIAHDTATASGRIVGTHTNISDRKNMEEQLRQSEKMQAIGQLAGGIAHDFNNQLSAILGYGEMLLGLVEKDERLARYARVVVASANHSADLTKKLLAFSRKGKSVNTLVDIHEVINEVCTLLERSIDKSVSLHHEFEAAPATVIGDAGLLQNALLNLGLNARDAMPKGGELTFHTEIIILTRQNIASHHIEVDPGEYLRINVSDTGTGMDKATINRIFEPFFTTKPEGKGTGMGLPAVYGTAKEHQGGITVTSELDHGTTFSLFLPLYRKHLDIKETKPKPIAVTGTGRILIIDDEEMVRELLCDFCTNFGYDVSVAASADDGIQIFRKNPESFDLVILDMSMPVKDGYQTFLELREIYPDVQVLILSGYSEGDNISHMLELGAYAHISKPVGRVELSQIIARAIKRIPYEPI